MNAESFGTLSVVISTILTGLNIYLVKIIALPNRFLLASIILILSGLILFLGTTDYPLISMVLLILTLKEGLFPIKLLEIAITFSSILGLSLLRGKS